MAVPAKYPIYTSTAMREYEEDIKRGKGSKALKTVGKYVPFVSPDAGAYWDDVDQTFKAKKPAEIGHIFTHLFVDESAYVLKT